MKMVCVLFILLSYNLLLYSQPQQLQISKLSVFLEGISYVTKTQNLKFESNKSLIEGPPDAINGAYWLGTSGDFSIKGVIVKTDTVYQPAQAKDFFDLLKANVGSKADVTYQIANEIESVSGEILPIDINTNIIAIKKVTGQTVFLKKEQIQQVAIQGNVKTTYMEKQLGTTTQIEIDKDLKQGNVNLMYYVNGISWAPTYDLEVINDSLSIFSMYALVVNHYQDFSNCSLMLFAGSANLNLKEKIQPLADDKNQPVVSGNDGNNETIRNPIPPLQAYEIDSVTMAKGSQAKFKIFSQEVVTQNLFECNIPNFIQTGKSFDTPLTEFPVYESAKWQNPTKIPYANGKVQILNKGKKSISEDEIPYTESGANLKVHIVTSPQILLTIYEEQIEKEEKVRKNSKNQYVDRFKIKGLVTIKNADEEKVYVEIHKKLLGRMTKTSMAEVIKTNEVLWDNPAMDVLWKYEVQGKNYQTIPYEYEFFLPSQK